MPVVLMTSNNCSKDVLCQKDVQTTAKRCSFSHIFDILFDVVQLSSTTDKATQQKAAWITSFTIAV